MRLAALLLLASLCGCTSISPSATVPSGEARLYVVGRGWHTDIGLAVDEVSGPLASLENGFPGVRYMVFGFGEREYYMARNLASRVQAARQQEIGIGWANHDHHTYRSSRRHFAKLVALWEKLGFSCRERYHAGMQAGWGAQVVRS